MAAKCTSVNERGAVGIRLKSAAAIVRQDKEHFGRRAVSGGSGSAKPPPLL